MYILCNCSYVPPSDIGHFPANVPDIFCSCSLWPLFAVIFLQSSGVWVFAWTKFLSLQISVGAYSTSRATDFLAPECYIYDMPDDPAMVQDGPRAKLLLSITPTRYRFTYQSFLFHRSYISCQASASRWMSDCLSIFRWRTADYAVVSSLEYYVAFSSEWCEAVQQRSSKLRCQAMILKRATQLCISYKVLSQLLAARVLKQQRVCSECARMYSTSDKGSARLTFDSWSSSDAAFSAPCAQFVCSTHFFWRDIVIERRAFFRRGLCGCVTFVGW